jgi:hypothetical protein
MAKATRVYHAKNTYADATIMEITIWRLPEPTDERPRGLKYSLFFGKAGERWVGYDDERGKGDHKHVFGRESPVRFDNTNELLQAFREDVRRARRRMT